MNYSHSKLAAAKILNISIYGFTYVNHLLVDRDIGAVKMAIGERIFRSILEEVERSPDVHPDHTVKGKSGDD